MTDRPTDRDNAPHIQGTLGVVRCAACGAIERVSETDHAANHRQVYAFVNRHWDCGKRATHTTKGQTK